MSDDLVYLKPNVQVEPLVDQWYAWPHLISPATAARNITGRHLKIMDSYISSPQVHANAVKNPKMLGGPFVDYGGKRVDEIRELRDRTIRERSDMMALSAALDELSALLKASADGFSLHPLYPQVPDLLRGYVELGYDLINHPNYRVIEPLLYRSRYYSEAAQSVMLRPITGDDRPFVLSTPRLEADDSVHIRVPFSDTRLDSLFRMTRIPARRREVQGLFDVPPGTEALFRSFFTRDAPAPYQPYRGNGVRWRYFGHACILIETRDTSILFDPVLSYTYESNISRYTYADLPDTIDYVLITHNHQDHILFETLLQLRNRIKHLIVPRNAYGQLQDPSLRLMFKNVGFSTVSELSEMESIELPHGEVVGLPFFGEHSDLAIGTKLAYYVRLGPHAMVFAADSCNIEPRLYEHAHKVVGDIDALFIGMECDGAPLSWLYGPLLPEYLDRAMDQSRRLCGSNYEQALAIVNEFNCRHVYVYAMGQEPWLNYIMSLKYTAESRPITESNRLIQDCASRGLCAERLFGEKEILLEAPVAAI